MEFANNLVEHGWSSCYNNRSCITLPAALEDQKPLREQSSLREEERMYKEAVVFDLALQQLCSIWNCKKHDGFSVVARAPACMSTKEAEHSSINSFFASGIGALLGNAEMRAVQEEITSLMHH